MSETDPHPKTKYDMSPIDQLMQKSMDALQDLQRKVRNSMVCQWTFCDDEMPEAIHIDTYMDWKNRPTPMMVMVVSGSRETNQMASAWLVRYSDGKCRWEITGHNGNWKVEQWLKIPDPNPSRP